MPWRMGGPSPPSRHVLAPTDASPPRPPSAPPGGSISRPTVPVPSGVDLTKVGSIFTEAVGLVSAPSPFSISFLKRWDTSWRVSSESRMW